MPVVNTTNSFSNNEQITSTKLNDIMDNSFFISGATVSGQGLEVTAGGQMQIKDLDVTTAKIADAGVTQAKLATNVVGNGPAFFAYPTSNQNVLTGVDTKVTLSLEGFDTNSNFSSSRFTPTVAGFYMITGSIGMNDNLTEFLTAKIFKNGVEYTAGTRIPGACNISTVSNIMYMNGSTDYIELYVRQATGVTKTISAGSNYTFFCGCLIRSA